MRKNKVCRFQGPIMQGQDLLFGYMNTRVTQVKPTECDISSCDGTYKQTNQMWGEQLAPNIKHVYCCNKCSDYIRYKQ